MNKAKAIFAAVIVVAVAGASAVFWQLNEKGIIGNEEETTTAYSADSEVNTKASEINNENKDTENSNTVTESTAALDDKNTTVSYDTKNEDINEFLSVFSKVYFSEDKAYSQSDYDTYELIRFAYSVTLMNNSSAVTLARVDDEIGYYHKISADTVNEVLEKYLGVTVEKKSVYTEKTYSFFKYSEGCFYSPAADGIGYVNTTISDSVTEIDNILYVDFTVYASGVTTDMTSQQARRASSDNYAVGSAKIDVSDGKFTLIYYEIEQ